MKLKPKKVKALPTKLTTATPIGIGVVKLTHHQMIKQSANYQSAEASYGAEVYCSDDPDDIALTIAKIEDIVESALLTKFREQGKVINNLGKGR